MTNKFHQVICFIRHFFKAKRNGHGIHSPFAYQLCEEVFYNTNSFYDFLELERTRKYLLNNVQELEIEDFGAGSRIFKTSIRKVKDIAAKGISSKKQSELLYKLINFLNSSNAVELGTSLGLNTLYMARVNRESQIYTLEGSKALFEFASGLAKKNKLNNIQFINEVFETGLPKILNDMKTLEVLYVDGNHTYEATLKYFLMALEKKHKDSVFIFDDIYWSPGMTKAWEVIKKNPAVTLSIDTFYFGIIFFKKEIKEKVDLKFYL